MIKAEVSLYPMESEDLHELAGLSHQFLNEHGLDSDFHLANTSLNSVLVGNPDQVWEALRLLFQQNQSRNREIIMVATLVQWN